MSITEANIKIYQCTTWTEGGTHGGAINTAAEITSGADQNIFDDVTDAQRVAGATDYRKIYVRNENADTWNAVKSWIETIPSNANTTISIAAATSAGVQSVEGVGATYYTPDTKGHANAISIGDLIQNASGAIWIKRVVAASAAGETGDGFTIGFGST
ncbi:hypothetical protein [Methanococcoides sp. AM1]|uniref:hypothetical protein n=1 Tax=Methanococcoides sp. AM1 TaxID=1201011 RepID=UPI0010834124|nr:hypothetical protein [Methanococcoides sp. AM1]